MCFSVATVETAVQEETTRDTENVTFGSHMTSEHKIQISRQKTGLTLFNQTPLCYSSHLFDYKTLGLLHKNDTVGGVTTTSCCPAQRPFQCQKRASEFTARNRLQLHSCLVTFQNVLPSTSKMKPDTVEMNTPQS